MPHISAKIHSGRTLEQKQKFAEAVKQCAVDYLNADAKYVTVSVEDIAPEDWKAVFDRDIHGNPNLIIRPNYVEPNS